MSNNITGNNAKQAAATATGRIMMGSATTTNMGISGNSGAIDAATYSFWGSAKVVNRVACFEVQEAENGYILRYGHKEGEIFRYKVAKDVEEVRDLVTSILVERKLGI
jgi:hypothetical protein